MNTELRVSRGSIENKKKRLVVDINSLVADADDLLMEIAHSTTDEFAAVRERIEGRVAAVQRRLDAARHSISDQACHAIDAGQHYVSENPWKVLTVAVAALVIGIVLSKR